MKKSLREQLDVRHPMFNPLWRRVALVGVTGSWTVFELISGNYTWGLLFGAAVAWCGYQFFVTWEDQEPPKKTD